MVVRLEAPTGGSICCYNWTFAFGLLSVVGTSIQSCFPPFHCLVLLSFTGLERTAPNAAENETPYIASLSASVEAKLFLPVTRTSTEGGHEK